MMKCYDAGFEKISLATCELLVNMVSEMQAGGMAESEITDTLIYNFRVILLDLVRVSLEFLAPKGEDISPEQMERILLAAVDQYRMMAHNAPCTDGH